MPADPDNDLLLITCASGKQSSALLPLVSKWKRLRLAVNSDASRERLSKAYPHAEVIRTDLYSVTGTTVLMKDVSVVIHIGPSYHPHEAEIGYMMIDAAVAAYDNGKGTLKHFILSSVLNTQFSKMMNHDCKRYVEEYVMESGLPYTVLQPTTFMDNLPLPMFVKESRPKFASPWNIDLRFSFICTRDLAAAMHTVLEQREKHVYAQYPLVSTHSPLSFRDAIGMIGTRLEKEIDVSVAEFRDGVDSLCIRLHGTTEVDPRTRDAAQRMILFYDNRGLVGNANVLEWLIGREATQFGEWVDIKLEGMK